MHNIPKVLIIGNTFQKQSGGGITMSNLFQGWPKDKIAVTTINVDKSDTSICQTYYRLGILEDYRPWIWGLFRNKKKSGLIKIQSLPGHPDYRRRISHKSIIKNIYLKLNVLTGKILQFTGFYNFVYQLRLSDNFIKWFDSYKPEVIYFQLASYQFMHFVNELLKIRPTALVIHFMDDHIATMAKHSLLYYYWKKKIDFEFRELINKAIVLMSICDSMSTEYEKRYNKKLYAFHNPVDTALWSKHSRTTWSNIPPFKILYAGRVGIGTDQSLCDIAETVESLSKEGRNIQFDIQINVDENGEADKFRKYSHTNIVKPVPYEELPKKLSSADLLVLPIDFHKKGLNYLRYSMPTKTSEYMISGTPVLVYAPEETALCKYARQREWGYVVPKRSRMTLRTALIKLYEDHNLRERLGNKAKEIASSEHDGNRIREQFRSLLSQ